MSLEFYVALEKTNSYVTLTHMLVLSKPMTEICSILIVEAAVGLDDLDSHTYIELKFLVLRSCKGLLKIAEGIGETPTVLRLLW